MISSDFYLDIEDISNWKFPPSGKNYRIKITAPADMAQAFYDYGNNFHTTANIIASTVLDAVIPDIAQLDTYVFPITYLYRQSAELILKAIAFTNILTDNDRREFLKATYHNPEVIMASVIERFGCTRPKGEVDWLQNYLHDMAGMDARSDSFRYPLYIVKEDGTYHLTRVFEKQTHIDLVKLVNKFEVAIKILQLWYAGDFSGTVDCKEFNAVFIEGGGNYYDQAVVGYGYNRYDYFPYLEAYQKTAEVLLSRMIDDYDQGRINTASQVFMPMCYLYRNAVELVLKMIWIQEIHMDFQNKSKIMLSKKHSIVGMWNKIAPLIKGYYADVDGSEHYFGAIRKCCETLQSYDNTSSRFRYPCDKNMKPYYSTNTSVDFKNFAIYMGSVVKTLDCLAADLSAKNEYLNDLINAYRLDID